MICIRWDEIWLWRGRILEVNVEAEGRCFRLHTYDILHRSSSNWGGLSTEILLSAPTRQALPLVDSPGASKRSRLDGPLLQASSIS